MNSPSSSNDPDLDWNAARQFCLRRLRFRLRFTREEEIEDLAQECLVGLLRFSRREALRTPEAVMTVIADRIAVSWIRSPRSRGLELPLEDGEGKTVDVPAPAEHDATALERLRFAVMEFFRETSAPCHELAGFFFRDLDWELVAGKVGRSYLAVRKQWSRCYESLQREEAREPGFLGQFLDGLS